MMATNSPSIFNRTNLSSGVSALRYDPGTSKIARSLPSYSSMMRLVVKFSREMVGKDTSYFVL